MSFFFLSLLYERAKADIFSCKAHSGFSRPVKARRAGPVLLLLPVLPRMAPTLVLLPVVRRRMQGLRPRRMQGLARRRMQVLELLPVRTPAPVLMLVLALLRVPRLVPEQQVSTWGHVVSSLLVTSSTIHYP